MQERFIAAADLGDGKISLSVSKVSGGVAQVVYYSQATSRGIQHGTVYNPKQVCQTLSELILQAEEELEIKINSIVTSYPRWRVFCKQVTKDYTRTDSDSFISDEEIYALQDSAQKDFSAKLDPTMKVYGVVAQSYSTETLFQMRKSEVIGSVSEKIEGDFNVYYGPGRSVSNIDKVCNELQIAVNKYFTPEAKAHCLLSEDELEHGVALVEIGAGVTSVSVFNKGVLRFYDSFPFGGKSVTNDVRYECKISENLAENIKKGYGSCMSDRLQTLSDKKLRLDESDSEDIPVKTLSEIVGSRMREIASAALELIARSGYANALRCGIVLSGGGARLLSCSALFSEMSGLPARVQFSHPGYISTEGFSSLSSPEGLEQLALIAIARDAGVNCATLKENLPESEPLTQDNAQTGNLFEEQESAEEETPKAEEPKPREESVKKKKEKKKKEKGGILTGLQRFTKDLFDENIEDGNNKEDKDNV